MSLLQSLPVYFFIALTVFVFLIWESLSRLRESWSRPAVAVYATVAAWYMGDLVYNGPDHFFRTFTPRIIDQAILEVCLFLIAFRVFISIGLQRYMQDDHVSNELDHLPVHVEETLFKSVVFAWAGVTIIGLFRLNGDIMSIIFPPLSDNPASPWGRAAVGSGLDFLVSFAAFFHMGTIGIIGVFVAIGRSFDLRKMAFVVFVIAIQPYLFQSARNQILAVCMPGILAYILIAGDSVWRKAAITTALFIALSAWFTVITGFRNEGSKAITGAFSSAARGETAERGARSEKHLGLDMATELCYINQFIKDRSYTENWGERYLAEITVVIPRTFWKKKPLLGIDYAVARGFGGGKNDHGVHATIATGMIGQGVVNFGRVLGPICAAGLMACWVGILSRLWCQRGSPQRLALFLLGLALTFNMGRDITLLVLFPFVISYILVVFYEHRTGTQPAVVKFNP